MGGTTLLTMAAMVLLSVFILSSNSLIQTNTAFMNESEYIITAISAGQMLIDEAKTKAFDENTISTPVATVKELTSSLGKEKDEVIDGFDIFKKKTFKSTTLFDDFDDYNGYKRIVSTFRSDDYTISALVQYVDPLNPDKSAVGQSFCKKITVIVTNPYLTVPVKLEYAMTQ